MLIPKSTLIAGIVVLLGTISARGQENAKVGSRRLVVSAGATVLAEPDTAVVTFVVRASGGVRKEVADKLGQRVKKMKDVLAELKLKDLAIEVVPATLSVAFVGDPFMDDALQVHGYQALSTFHVTAREKDKEKLRAIATKISHAAVDNGGTGHEERRFRSLRLGLGNDPPEVLPGPRVVWRCEKDKTARQQAIKEALDNALADAKVIAGDAILHVEDIQVRFPDSLLPLRIPLVDVVMPDPGAVPIRVDVQITCKY